MLKKKKSPYRRNVKYKDMVGFKFMHDKKMHIDRAMHFITHRNIPRTPEKKRTLCVYFKVFVNKTDGLWSKMGQCQNVYSKHYYTITNYNIENKEFMCDSCGMYRIEKHACYAKKKKK